MHTKEIIIQIRTKPSVILFFACDDPPELLFHINLATLCLQAIVFSDDGISNDLHSFCIGNVTRNPNCLDLII